MLGFARFPAAVLAMSLAVLFGIGGSGGVDASAAATFVQRDGWRTVTWHQTTFQVPPSWAYGGLTDWCGAEDARRLSPGELSPRVLLPSMNILSIECGSAVLGVDVQAVSDGMKADREPTYTRTADYPDGAWIGARQVGDALVRVYGPDQATAVAIMNSVHDAGALDDNGCFTSLSDAASPKLPPMIAEGGVACEYQAGALALSQPITPAQIRVLEQAIGESPRKSAAAVRAGACADEPTYPTLLLHGQQQWWLLRHGRRGCGSITGLTTWEQHEVTGSILRPLLHWDVFVGNLPGDLPRVLAQSGGGRGISASWGSPSRRWRWQGRTSGR